LSGGTERPDGPEIWTDRFASAETIDGRIDACDPDHARWFSPSSKGQPTRIAPIRTLLAFKGEPADDVACLAYQRERFAAGNGDEAVLELSAYAAANLGVDSARERYKPQRIERIRELLAEHRPAFFACYGLTRGADFEDIVGGPFDADGFRVSGSTVCAIAMHPTPRFRPAPPPSFWVGLGLELRRRAELRN